MCAPIGQACLLQVHCMDFAIFPLVPHQHCPGGGVSMGTVPFPRLSNEPWINSSGCHISSLYYPLLSYASVSTVYVCF